MLRTRDYIEFAVIAALIIGLVLGIYWLGNAITANSNQRASAELHMVCDAAQGQYVLNSNGTASCYYPKPTPIGAGR